MEVVMNINKLKMKNLRCFSEVKNEIRPITIIVGENNTGKTTFLSAYKLVHDLLYGNKPIAPSSIEDLLKENTYKYLGGPENLTKKQSKSDIVNIGATLKVGKQDIWNVEYSIVNGKFCQKICIDCSENKIEIHIKGSSTLEVFINDYSEIFTIPAQFSIHFFGIIAFLCNDSRLKTVLDENKNLGAKISSLIKFKESGNLENTFCNFVEPVHIIPKTQYDPKQIKTTDSSHILCRIAEMKQKNNWNEISAEFNNFGRKSKLFQDLDIVAYGKDQDSPFSIKVTVDELKSDITNVGYGVSQFLPVLANVFISDQKKYNTFLMQQPETHLHPRVEAEFTTLMINMINKYNKKYRFICETHSDYIMQRARIEIQKKNLDPRDFLILYFELQNGGAKIYPITIDSNGNIENQPDSYQAFFLSEDYDLLGLKD